MAKVNTNDVGLQFTVEASTGILPNPALEVLVWKKVEPNDIGAYGAEITTTERRPISSTRGRRKGAVTDLDSKVEYDADLSLDAFTDFAEGFTFSEFANAEFDLRLTGSGTPTPPPLPPTVLMAVAGYTIDQATALLADKVQFAVTTSNGHTSLVFAKGYAIAGNNGLKAITADLATSGALIPIATGLTEEVPPTNASLQVAGIRTLGTDTVQFTKTGTTGTLVSAGANPINWTTLGLQVGMYVHVGSDDGNGVVQNAFPDAVPVANAVFGYARITAIAASVLSLDKLDSNLSVAAAAHIDIDIMFGRFLRNVPTIANADDNRFLNRTYQFEVLYPDLGGVGVDEFEYAIGNSANEIALDLGLADKAGVKFAFVGTNSDNITATRKGNAVDARSVLRAEAVNTSSDLASLSTDIITAVSDVCFKTLTLTLKNNVSTEKCLGTLGARFVNAGLFEVNLNGQMLFTNKAIVNAIKNNTTVTFAAILKNSDGAIAVDIPSLTFGGGDRDFPLDESVLVNVTGVAFNDPSGTIPDVSLGISVFASVPTVRP